MCFFGKIRSYSAKFSIQTNIKEYIKKNYVIIDEIDFFNQYKNNFFLTKNFKFTEMISILYTKFMNQLTILFTLSHL